MYQQAYLSRWRVEVEAYMLRRFIEFTVFVRRLITIKKNERGLILREQSGVAALVTNRGNLWFLHNLPFFF